MSSGTLQSIARRILMHPPRPRLPTLTTEPVLGGRSGYRWVCFETWCSRDIEANLDGQQRVALANLIANHDDLPEALQWKAGDRGKAVLFRGLVFRFGTEETSGNAIIFEVTTAPNPSKWKGQWLAATAPFVSVVIRDALKRIAEFFHLRHDDALLVDAVAASPTPRRIHGDAARCDLVIDDRFLWVASLAGGVDGPGRWSCDAAAPSRGEAFGPAGDRFAAVLVESRSNPADDRDFRSHRDGWRFVDHSETAAFRDRRGASRSFVFTIAHATIDRRCEASDLVMALIGLSADVAHGFRTTERDIDDRPVSLVAFGIGVASPSRIRATTRPVTRVRESPTALLATPVNTRTAPGRAVGAIALYRLTLGLAAGDKVDDVTIDSRPPGTSAASCEPTADASEKTTGHDGSSAGPTSLRTLLCMTLALTLDHEPTAVVRTPALRPGHDIGRGGTALPARSANEATTRSTTGRLGVRCRGIAARGTVDRRSTARATDGIGGRASSTSCDGRGAQGRPGVRNAERRRSPRIRAIAAPSCSRFALGVSGATRPLCVRSSP